MNFEESIPDIDYSFEEQGHVTRNTIFTWFPHKGTCLESVTSICIMVLHGSTGTLRVTSFNSLDSASTIWESLFIRFASLKDHANIRIHGLPWFYLLSGSFGTKKKNMRIIKHRREASKVWN